MEEEKKNHALPTQEKWIDLSSEEVKHIFWYYAGLFLGAIIFCAVNIIVGFTLSETGIVLHRLMEISFSFGLLGSTFYYIRKLYKSCIQLIIKHRQDGKTATLGAKAYFYLRPIMGAVLAFIICLGIYGGFFFLQDQPSLNTGKFYIFSAVISFFVGFSNGKFITRIDNSSDKIAEMIQITKEKTK